MIGEVCIFKDEMSYLVSSFIKSYLNSTYWCAFLNKQSKALNNSYPLLLNEPNVDDA